MRGITRSGPKVGVQERSCLAHGSRVTTDPGNKSMKAKMANMWPWGFPDELEILSDGEYISVL